MAVPAPDDGISIVHWLVGSVGGAVGALLTAAGFLWRAASVASAARLTLAQHRKDIDMLEQEVKQLVLKNDARHDENQRALHSLERTVAAQPDKQDFQRLEDKVGKSLEKVDRSLDEIKQSLARR
jgi:hypothetical protein